MNAADPAAHTDRVIPSDAAPSSWVDSAPRGLEPFLRLSRFDRPIGFWLLAAPCWVGMVFARMEMGWPQGIIDIRHDAIYALLFGLGAVAMRGAGCTWNDILDRKIDAQVSRTAGRPLPAGRVTLKAALGWLMFQCLVGLLVLLTLPRFAQYVALAAIPMVALYPLMKRITWWPQVWLGLTFNWGVLVGFALLHGTLTLVDILLFGALALWTLGYDTIYALQDKEDDALVGVKSPARLFGDKAQAAVFIIYGLSILVLAVCTLMSHEPAGLLGVVLFGGHLALQATRTGPGIGDAALGIFKSNRDAVLILIGGWLFAAIWF